MTAEVRDGILDVAYAISTRVGAVCEQPGPNYSLQATATVVIDVADTTYPTLGPTTTLAPIVAAVTPGPTAEATTATTGLYITSFEGLQPTTEEKMVTGVILFERQLDLIDTPSYNLRGPGIFDGQGMTRLLHLEEATLRLTEISLRNGYAHSGGCGWVTRSSHLVLSRTTIQNCIADVSGGGFYLETSILEASSSIFDSNSAKIRGGAVILGRTAGSVWFPAAAEGSLFQAEDCHFRKNKITTNKAETFASGGGVLYVDDTSHFEARNSTFEENFSQDNAGVIMLRKASTAVVKESSFAKNDALFGGVAMVWEFAELTVVNSTFENNRATLEPHYGDIAYLEASATVGLHNSTISTRAETPTVRCVGTGTIYADRLQFQENVTFRVDENCALLFYQSNFDGSNAYRQSLFETEVLRSECRDGRTGSLNLISWSYVCNAGQWSSDGLEHGDAVDRNGISIDENDPFCDNNGTTVLPDCPSACQTCPAGKYLDFSLNRFAHLGVDSCAECPVGRFLEDSENWWDHDSLEDCHECPAGKVAREPGSATCVDCAEGTFATFQFGRSECQPAEPGNFVNISGATEQRQCPPGTFSNGGDANCIECPKGSFNPNVGQASCRGCPSPMTTIGPGSIYCDACVRSYFWNTAYLKEDYGGSLEAYYLQNEEQCVDCCTRCEDICDHDDLSDDCVDCKDGGQVLETLDVKRGWWRPTNQSQTIYECPGGSKTCRGGTSTREKIQCFDGHVGALCGACKHGYDFDIARNRCTPCSALGVMLARVGNVSVIVLTFFIVLYSAFRKWQWRLIFFYLKDQATEGLGFGGSVDVADDMHRYVNQQSEDEEKSLDKKLSRNVSTEASSLGRGRRRRFRRLVLTN